MSHGMHGSNDAETAVMAAEKLLPRLGDLQQQVLDAFRERGPMTDGECERLPRFARCGYSTIRKRCTELRQMGWLRPTGEKRNRMMVCEAVPSEQRLEQARAEAEGWLF